MLSVSRGLCVTLCIAVLAILLVEHDAIRLVLGSVLILWRLWRQCVMPRTVEARQNRALELIDEAVSCVRTDSERDAVLNICAKRVAHHHGK